MRMKCLRIFPETMPRISRSLLSSLSLNIALGNACDTVASTSIGSDFATQYTPFRVSSEQGDVRDHIWRANLGQGAAAPFARITGFQPVSTYRGDTDTGCKPVIRNARHSGSD